MGIGLKIGKQLGKLWIGRAAIALLATLLFVVAGASGASAADLSPGLQEKLDEITEQGETGRPRTPRQWEAEAAETQGMPLKRFERIVEESVDAVGEMIEVYPANVEMLTSNPETDGSPQAGEPEAEMGAMEE